MVSALFQKVFQAYPKGVPNMLQADLNINLFIYLFLNIHLFSNQYKIVSDVS